MTLEYTYNKYKAYPNDYKEDISFVRQLNMLSVAQLGRNIFCYHTFRLRLLEASLVIFLYAK